VRFTKKGEGCSLYCRAKIMVTLFSQLSAPLGGRRKRSFVLVARVRGLLQASTMRIMLDSVEVPVFVCPRRGLQATSATPSIAISLRIHDDLVWRITLGIAQHPALAVFQTVRWSQVDVLVRRALQSLRHFQVLEGRGWGAHIPISFKSVGSPDIVVADKRTSTFGIFVTVSFSYTALTLGGAA